MLVRAQQERLRRKELRQAKERIKPRSKWLSEAQAEFNAYIRARDHALPCISCDIPASHSSNGKYWHASHYRSRGACPELRFNELNVHKSCAQCNSSKSGNVVEYRIRLREKIGDEALAWLEGPHEPKKYTIADLKEIRDTYRRKTREIQR